MRRHGSHLARDIYGKIKDLGKFKPLYKCTFIIVHTKGKYTEDRTEYLIYMTESQFNFFFFNLSISIDTALNVLFCNTNRT